MGTNENILGILQDYPDSYVFEISKNTVFS